MAWPHAHATSLDGSRRRARRVRPVRHARRLQRDPGPGRASQSAATWARRTGTRVAKRDDRRAVTRARQPLARRSRPPNAAAARRHRGLLRAQAEPDRVTGPLRVVGRPAVRPGSVIVDACDRPVRAEDEPAAIGQLQLTVPVSRAAARPGPRRLRRDGVVARPGLRCGLRCGGGSVARPGLHCRRARSGSLAGHLRVRLVGRLRLLRLRRPLRRLVTHVAPPRRHVWRAGSRPLSPGGRSSASSVRRFGLPGAGSRHSAAVLRRPAGPARASTRTRRPADHACAVRSAGSWSRIAAPRLQCPGPPPAYDSTRAWQVATAISSSPGRAGANGFGQTHRSAR